MQGKIVECAYPERKDCLDCVYSLNPDLHDGGCELFKPATEKQMSYAQDIADELGIDLPEELSIGEVSRFITNNVDDYYESRRQRKGGYAEMYERIDRREL